MSYTIFFFYKMIDTSRILVRSLDSTRNTIPRIFHTSVVLRNCFFYTVYFIIEEGVGQD